MEHRQVMNPVFADGAWDFGPQPAAPQRAVVEPAGYIPQNNDSSTDLDSVYARSVATSDLGYCSNSSDSDEGMSSWLKSRAHSLRNRYLEQKFPLKAVPEQLSALSARGVQSNLDAMFDGAVSSVDGQPAKLKHHIFHRAVLGVALLACSGASQWLGYRGLSVFFARQGLTEDGASAFSFSITAMSFVTSNLFGAYAANRMLFEGVFTRSQIATGLLALVPVSFEAYAAYGSLVDLAIPIPLAVIGASINLISNQFFLWNMLEKYPDFLMGYDSEKEDEADRAVWLQTQLLNTINKHPDLLIRHNGSWRAAGAAAAEMLVNESGAGPVFMKILPLSSKAHKTRNILASLQERAKSRKSTAVVALDQEARDARLTGCRLWTRLGAYSALHVLNMSFVWGILSPLASTLIRSTNANTLCSQPGIAAQYTYYHIAGQLAATGSAITDTMLVWSSFTELAKWVKERRWHELCRPVGALNGFLFGVGLITSASFTLSSYGLVWSGLHTDVCLKGQINAERVLPAANALAGFLITWSLGAEFTGVFCSAYELGRALFRPCLPLCSRKNRPRQAELSQEESRVSVTGSELSTGHS